MTISLPFTSVSWLLVLLAEDNLCDVVFRDDEVGVLVGLGGVVLVVIDVAGPRVDGVVRLVAVGDAECLEEAADRGDVGQAVVGEVPVGQRYDREGVEVDFLRVLSGVGRNEGIHQHIGRRGSVAFREIVAGDAVEAVLIHLVDPLRVVAGHALGYGLAVGQQVVEQFGEMWCRKVRMKWPT